MLTAPEEGDRSSKGHFGLDQTDSSPQGDGLSPREALVVDDDSLFYDLPAFDCLRIARIKELKSGLESEDLGYVDKLRTGATLLSQYRDTASVKMVVDTICQRADQIRTLDSKGTNDREVSYGNEAAAWDKLLIGLEYHGSLDKKVLDAYLETIPVSGKKSPPDYAFSVLHNTFLTLNLLQRKCNPIFKVLNPTQADDLLQSVSEKMIQAFVEEFDLDGEAVREELGRELRTKSPKKLRGYIGQLSLNFS